MNKETFEFLKSLVADNPIGGLIELYDIGTIDRTLLSVLAKEYGLVVLKFEGVMFESVNRMLLFYSKKEKLLIERVPTDIQSSVRTYKKKYISRSFVKEIFGNAIADDNTVLLKNEKVKKMNWVYGSVESAFDRVIRVELDTGIDEDETFVVYREEGEKEVVKWVFVDDTGTFNLRTLVKFLNKRYMRKDRVFVSTIDTVGTIPEDVRYYVTYLDESDFSLYEQVYRIAKKGKIIKLSKLKGGKT